MAGRSANFSNLHENDIINVWWQPSETEPKVIHRARILQLHSNELIVEIAYQDELHTVLVSYTDIEKRVSLPWKPKDLRDNLIVFQRRQGRTNEYVQDLVVRRNMVLRILTLLTAKGHRGIGHEEESLHQYYNANAFEWSQENLDELPEDGVPED